MSGHSKWATIRRKKEKIDAARGKVFTKLIREIQIASRMGGSDPNSNPRLRTAVDAAKAANMPAANLEKAIKKGAGELDGQVLEEIVYEGYGPAGVAILIECATDNRNRTVGEIRAIFNKRGGSMAEAGAVSWMFERLGYLTLDKSQGEEEEVMMLALEAGATDVKDGGEIWEVYCATGDLYVVKGALEAAGKTVDSAELSYIPNNTVKVEAADSAKSVLTIIELLEEIDDAQNVYSNYEMDDALIESLA
ncbi:MAG: YebC/PmpR family DNA-binding transcriptional regulator [Calditrichaeota bacterium]|nr:YebC/PmpR family DNA-binding transcriptional regulator [Calditrichota bacterium]MCB9368454.1 YebC/PmpR family DNA-binding transcriptional regulator [Calditrichota bacterium]